MEIRLLTEADREHVVCFLDKNTEQTVELAGRIEKYSFRNDRIHKKSGDAYGIFRETELTGLLHFSNHKSLAVFFTDFEILKKVILLKIIRQHQPRNVQGIASCMDPIYQMIAKSLQTVRYSECYHLLYAGGTSEGAILPANMTVVDARQFDLNRAVDFLIESEKAFGRKPRMVNDLRLRIQDREDQETYLFLLDGERVVAQGLIEFHTSRYARISGVYTAMKDRRKGYGAILVRQLMAAAEEMNRTPSLLVEKKNRVAVSLYEHLGFHKGPNEIVLDVEMEPGK